MTSSCGRIVIVYNGELYNTAELRSDLEAVGRKFRGSSDTEVIVEGFAEYGIENFVRRLDGIFAFGAYDSKSKTLWLGRDHLGVKPLFYGQFEGLTIFGSEIKALTAHPGWNKRINVSVIAEYLNRDYIPAPDSIYEGIFKLMPGSLVRIDHNGSKKDIGYWTLEDVIAKSRHNQFEDINDASNALSKLLVETVGRQMVSDVPLGGLLSGGIDSSLIVALMQQAASRPVETFSLGFLESEHNEAPHASRVAKYLGTNHHEVYVTPDQMLPLVYEMPNIYDEPFADSSQLPTYLITRLASQHVKVALSGDGGDELFGGYRRYISMRRIVKTVESFPRPLREKAAHYMLKVPPEMWHALSRLIPPKYRPEGASNKFLAMCALLATGSTTLYRTMNDRWSEFNKVIIGGHHLDRETEELMARQIVPDLIARWQYLDTKSYLPDDILAKVDRASMSNSLEVRVPLLAHQVVEMSWRIPTRFNVDKNMGKMVLRKVLANYLPKELILKPKRGFGIPIDAWLRGPLSCWVEDFINPTSLKKFGLVEPETIWQCWQDHKSGKENWGYHLWNVVMLHAWLEANNVG